MLLFYVPPPTPRQGGQIFKFQCELLVKPFVSQMGMYLHDSLEVIRFHIQSKQSTLGAKLWFSAKVIQH